MWPQPVDRLLGGLSARRLGAALFIDLHRTSVTRWEVLFTAALLASVRRWYENMQALLPEQVGPAEVDEVFMISYVVDGQGFLIISRDVVGEDIDDSQYTLPFQLAWAGVGMGMSMPT